jgi:hypothetical protein
MDDLKGLLVKYPVFDNGEFDFNQYGRIVDFMSVSGGVEALIITNEGDEIGDYYFDSVPINNLIAPREGNELYFRQF